MGKGLLICCHRLTIKPIKKHVALTFCCSPVFSRDAPVAVFLASKLTEHTNKHLFLFNAAILFQIFILFF